jgi:hypothetical protein
VAYNIFSYMNWDRFVAIEMGRWAAANLPRGSRIIYTHTAIDPQLFPDQKLLGLIKYTDLLHYKPDYLILSSGIYDAPWYYNLRKTQHLSPTDPDHASVRLYQDLLDKTAAPTQPGPTAVPGIELVKALSTSIQPSYAYTSTIASCSWLERILGLQTYERLSYIYLLLRMRLGLEQNILLGNTLMLYHVDLNLLQDYVAGTLPNEQ